MKKRDAAWIVGGLLMAALAGCGGQKKETVSRVVFYPPPPDEPRLQFLLSFNDAEEWTVKKSSFSQFVVGGQEEASTAIMNPYGVAAHEGRVYVCDLAVRKVRVIDMAGKSYRELGAPGQLKNPVNVTVDADGTKYVCDTGANVVAVFDATDNYVRSLGDAKQCSPIDLAIAGDELYVVNIQAGRVEVWDREGKVLRTFGSRGFGPEQFRVPTNLAIGPDGNVYVVDTELQIVKVFTPQGQFVRTVGAPGDRPGFFARPKGIAIDAEGRIYVADAQWELIQVFNPQGRLLMFFGGASEGPESLGLPAGVAVDATSLDALQQYVSKDFEPQYLLFVANQFGHRKIGVYAFGHRKGVTPVEPSAEAATQPAATQASAAAKN